MQVLWQEKSENKEIIVNKIEINNLDLYYGDFHALKNINLKIPENQITAFIGPSGCGKLPAGSADAPPRIRSRCAC